MPAIRYFHQCTFAVVDHTPSHSTVDVRLKDGSYERLPWLGMICEHAAERLPGMGYAKIKAHEVTDGDGLMKCEWRRLITGEHVLGWRCHSQDGKTCIYGVVDLRSWPIVIGQNGRKGEPRLAIVVNGS